MERSLDVKALCPNLGAEFTAEIVAKEFRRIRLEVEGVDSGELGIYLAINKTEKDLEELGLLEYCPRRKTKRGRAPTVTGKATTSNKNKERYEPWKHPTKVPDKVVEKAMLSEALHVAVKYIMDNHIYGFHETTRKQASDA